MALVLKPYKSLMKLDRDFVSLSLGLCPIAYNVFSTTYSLYWYVFKLTRYRTLYSQTCIKRSPPEILYSQTCIKRSPLEILYKPPYIKKSPLEQRKKGSSKTGASVHMKFLWQDKKRVTFRYKRLLNKGGLLRQGLLFTWTFNDRTRKVWPLNTSVCLIHVTVLHILFHIFFNH